MTLEIYLLQQMRQSLEDIIKEDLALMLQVVDAKVARVMEFIRLRCTFYQMFMYLVKFVKVKDIILKL